MNSSLQLISGGSSQTIDLGDIAAGFVFAPELQFPDTAQFSAAFFSATLDLTTFQLDGGATFTVSSPVIGASLLPLAGGDLVAGTDFTLIAVSDEVTNVPEPAPYALLLAGLIYVWHRRRLLYR